MSAITACAAALAAVTVGLLLRSEYEKKHFVTDQYEIECKCKRCSCSVALP